MHRSIMPSCLLLLAACGDSEQGAPPVLSDISLSTAEDTPLTVPITLSAVNALPTTLSVVTPPSHGTLTGYGPTFVYTPAVNFFGSDAVVVSAENMYGTATATASITITAVDDGPVANPDSFTTGFNAPLTVAQATLLANDTDLDSATLSVLTVAAATHGMPALSGSDVVFTPDAGFTGTAAFTYTVSDGTVNAAATVTVSVGPDSPPVAVADTATTDEDNQLTLAAATLITNDSDVDGDSLSVSAVAETASSHGTVALGAGFVMYTPAADFTGTADFTYTVSDGNGGTATGTVTVTVNPINDIPVAVDDAVTATENTVRVFPATELAANDTDLEGDALTVTAVAVTATTHGTVTLGSSCGLHAQVCAGPSSARKSSLGAPASSVRYVPTADYNGPADFDYTVSDGHGGTATGHVTVTVVASDVSATTR
jgi:hypothetical protein